MATAKETAAAKTATTPPVPLTLQQKFIKLREAVPSITQKAHSDGVKYKFAKIFDVYQLLTPAMNEFGVNFDIVGEQATRHSENGDPIYYSNFTQHTRNGDRIVWVYEADLTIRWTNADNPDETLEVTLHAIGTNDGGPDKAKGSAWTYCLKYYLFEKFGIDQGDDDPDMSDHSSEPPQQSQKQHTGAQNGNRQGNTQPQAQNGQTGRSGAARPLSDAQLSRLYRKGEDAGYSQQSINEWILKKYGQQDPHNLTRAQYDEACAAMDNAKQRSELEALISEMEKPDEQTVLEMHYFDAANWWTVCAALHGSREDYDEHEQRYLKRTFKLHGSALQSLAKIYRAKQEQG